MQIGILSDTHNNIENLQAALQIFRKNNLFTIFHCGDMTRVEVVPLLDGFRVIYLVGNSDVLWGEIRRSLLELNPESYGDLIFTGEIDGVKIAAAHGHLDGVIEGLVRSGEYDFVFCGHSHRHNEVYVGKTRLINPGALGGLKVEPRSICQLDLDSGLAKFVTLP